MVERGTMAVVVAVLAVSVLLVVLARLLGDQWTGRDVSAPQLETRTPPDVIDTRLTAYLQGYQQGQLICPGADLSGRVSKVIIDPAAATVGAPGDCTLADMRLANPGTEFYAYVDVAAMRSVNEHQGDFQSTCADPAHDGAEYTIESENPLVASDAQGRAVYPQYEFLILSDLSAGYAETCVAMFHRMLSAVSAPGISEGAEPTRFDGIFLDDVSMTPGHGQNYSDIGPWGPWESDAAYGRAMIDTVVLIDRDLDRAMGRDVPIAVNLGMDPQNPEQVRLAVELARTGVVDEAVREFTVATGTGAPLNEDEMLSLARVHRNLAANGMPVTQHDYSVPLRDAPLALYEQGREVPPEPRCLEMSNERVDQIRHAAALRRIHDHRMLLGHTLIARTEGSDSIAAAISQAEPFCQTTAASTRPMAEDVTEASVNLDDPEVEELTRALADEVHPLGELETSTDIWHQEMSNGQVVLLNTHAEAQRVDLHGRNYEVPGRSALIEGP
ncbi:hypothetical protein [Kocuria arenosa]|uniref:hypothetical protein n=1 Tax=Kocuria arenosa TaxID=3071446 RepID=UPI0034D5B645